ncbi:MAG: 30S ribosomal protein S16 [Sphingobacteriales bacterium]|jgi:small subunit ribosomal protein S16|nr:30S ribosomal protein S16 [Sphingobacteriales bacterium]HNY55575.1 30S ribosomal protein S16 [Chitinophagales bacterium]
MATRLRLQRHGAKGAPFYKIVAADSRAKRDGRYIDQIGTYNPTSIPATIILDVDKAVKWLQTGAEPSSTVKAILSYKGAMYKKHLLRGVQLGVVKAEDVEAKFTEWLSKKEGKVLDHKEKAEAKKKAKIEAVVNTPAKVKEVEVVAEETPAAEEEVTPVAEATENTEATAETTETAE